MKKIILSISLILFSNALLAQQAFDGFNFQLGIGASQSQIKANNTDDTTLRNNPNINNTTTGTSFNGVASVGYSQSFDSLLSGFNLAANIFYVIGNQAAGNVSNNFSTSH